MTTPESDPTERAEREPGDTPNELWFVPGAGREVGDWIGPYRILDVLGKGGFGIVYLAEQREPVERRVAVKMILFGMETEAVVARFEAERQALALLNHPHVAMVHDAGSTEDGRPYFVMEHVPGTAVTKYCDTHQLDIEERLSLFLQICEAVQHAHQKGIIHRDLKPGNVLVSETDEGPVAKVIDFGVAKAIDRRLTEKTIFTRVGQLIGTPEYMSPEQANPTVHDVDTRTDIYSLGVLLYELLVGARPFDPESLRLAALGEIQRIIREVEPARPSTRLTGLGEKTATVAHDRHTDPSSLMRALRGDLDWITMKAMEKDRTRRYPSASELAEDIRRFLRHEATTAGPPRVAYRVRKFVRRHRGPVIAASLVAIALIAGIVGTTTQAVRATRARDDANRATAEAVYRAYVGQIAAAEGAVRANEMRAARRHLDLAPIEHRGWEWRHLLALADGSDRVLEGHKNSVVAVAVSPDGGRLASGSVDCTVRVWSVATGACEVVLDTGDDFPKRVAFLPGGREIVVLHGRGTVAVWDVAAGTPRVLSAKGGSADDDAASSADHALFAVARERGAIELFDLTSGARTEWPTPDRTPRSIAVSPDGSTLVIGDAGGRLALVDAADGSVRASWAAHDDAIRRVAFGLGGATVASGGEDHRVRVWDVASRSMLAERVHVGPVRGVAATGNGLFAAASHDRTLSCVAADGTAAVLRGHGGGVYAVTALPGGRRIASASEDGTVRLWATDRDAYRRSMTGHGGRVDDVAISADGRHIASVSVSDRSVLVWDADRRRRVLSIGAGEVQARRCALSPSGTELLTLDHDGALRRWDVRTGRELGSRAPSPVGRTPPPFAQERDGGHVAWSDAENVIRTIGIDLTGEREIARLDMTAVDLAWGAAGGRLAAIGEDTAGGGRVIVWDLAGAAPRELLALDLGRPQPGAVALTPDGETVIVTRHRGNILVIDVDDPSVRRAFGGLAESRLPLAVSPDGARLFVAWPDDSIRVWDLARGELLLALRGHSDDAVALSLSENGDRIVSAGRDKLVRIWESRE